MQQNSVNSCRPKLRAHYEDNPFEVVKQTVNNYILWQRCYDAPQCKTKTFFVPWLQDSGNTAGFSAWGKRENAGQGRLYPNTGVSLLQNNQKPNKGRCSWQQQKKITVTVGHKFGMFALSDFDSESLPANGIHGKTSAAVVPETKEPGQAEFAQKVSGSQVSTDMDTHS